MEVHIGKVIKKVMLDKRMRVADLGKKVDLHPGSLSRIFNYPSMQVEALKKFCLALEYDFFVHYTSDFKFKSEAEKTECEKLLAQSQEENERMKQEIVYLKQINELLLKK